MLRESSRRLAVGFICCALVLPAGTLPAAAQPGLDSSSGTQFEVGSWLARLWQQVGEPVVSLFAAESTVPPPPPAPPTTNGGVCIDPSGAPGPASCIDRI